jgi:STE24 endopeptidase
VTDLFYTALLVIVTLEFLLGVFLEYINLKNAKPDVPPELDGYYNKEKFALQLRYEKETTRFGILRTSVSFTVTFIVIAAGGFGMADEWLRGFLEDEFWLSVAWFCLFGSFMFIFSLPFGWYSTFVIEQKYGFNKSTPKIFVADLLKTIMLSLLIGLPLLMFIVWFYLNTGIWFVLWVFMLITGVSLFFTLFYSQIIVPLFNKQTPLEEGELRTAIEDFCQKTGFRLRNVYKIDGSKRSTKANAYFTGLGPKKRIVLFDTLIKEMTSEEIVAVLAHEVGHYKKKHIPVNMLLSLFQTAVMLLLLYFALKIPGLSYALGSDIHSFYLGITAFGILMTPVSLLTGLMGSMLSRKFEFQADAFAVQYGMGISLATALKKLSVNNLTNPYPHPLYVFFHYSHPPILERLKRLENI